MEKIRVGIVEDELLIAIRLQGVLEELGYDVLAPVENYSDGLQLVQSQKPDILICDIQLSGRKTGIELAEKIREFNNLPIIFLTSYSEKETIDHARSVRPNAYLIKPFNKEELYSAIEIAMMNHKPIQSTLNEPKFHFVKVKDAYEKIEESDIIYVNSDHVYLEIHTTAQKKFVIRKSMNAFVEELGADFIRIHKSYIVNMRHVSRLSSSQVVIGELELPVGKSYKADVAKLRESS